MIDIIFITIFIIGSVYGITKEYAPRVKEWYNQKQKSKTITIKIKTKGDL